MPPITKRLSDVPEDWSNHGVEGLICTPATWTSVVVFYAVNYLAHCVTVKPYAAETPAEITIAMALALFLPSSGITRALDSIIRRPRFRKLNELERAAISGALCMVIRSENWHPNVGDVLRNLHLYDKPDNIFKSLLQLAETYVTEPSDEVELLSQPGSFHSSPGSAELSLDEMIFSYKLGNPPWMKDDLSTSHMPRTISERHCKVHGIYSLPDGYELAYVPSNAVVKPFNKPTETAPGKLSCEISSSYSFTKAAIAIVQTMYASVSLYQSRGDQISVYGYAAFGPTVIPYILMSILNLIGQIATPDYPTLYLIHSQEMDEARCRGGTFDGVIGTLEPTTTQDSMGNSTAVDEASGPWAIEKIMDKPVGNRSGLDSARTSNSIQYFELRNMNVRNRTDARMGQKENIFLENNKNSDESPAVLLIPCSSRFQRKGESKFPPKCSSSSWKPEIRVRRHGSSFLLVWAPLIFGAISILLVGVLSAFRKGLDSTSVERGFTMAWLVVGMLFGVLSREMSKFLLHTKGMWSLIRRLIGFAVLFGVFLVPGLGGFVVVGKMILDFGSCTHLS